MHFSAFAICSHLYTIDVRMVVLVLLMLVNPIETSGAAVVTSYPLIHREMESVSRAMLIGKDPKEYCLKLGKRLHKQRTREYN